MKGMVNGEWSDLSGDVMPELPSTCDGVFETLLLRGRVPVFWEQHWNRFVSGCRHYGLRSVPSESQVAQAIDVLAAANGITEGVVRYVAWKPDAGLDDRVCWRVDVGLPRPHMRKPRLTVEWGAPAVSPSVRDAAFKHLRRTAWGDALRAARSRGFDEALLRDASGHLVEGAVSNVFFVRNGALCYPALELGGLRGVVRAAVIACAETLGLPLSEGAFSAEDLQSASEIWLTNSLIGIRPVIAVGDEALPDLQPVLTELRTGWQRLHGWDPVVISIF